MAIKVLTNPKSNLVDPEILVTDPVAIAERDVRHDERHDFLRQPVKWTVPQISNASPAFDTDESLSLEMGVVYHLQMMSNYLIQNISENEDDRIEFSMHGDADGTWGLLNTGGMLKATGDLFLLNRTHMENLRVAMILEP